MTQRTQNSYRSMRERERERDRERETDRQTERGGGGREGDRERESLEHKRQPLKLDAGRDFRVIRAGTDQLRKSCLWQSD